jgi:phosphopantetheinyl transferase (holo-ACP synthase)
MTGNDLVDLRAAATESNWHRNGFLNKIFTGTEQDLISNALLPHKMLWLLWSMKEAAYKIYNRRSGIRAYAPIKLQCEITRNTDTTYYGKVCIANLQYHTKSTVSADDYIHTIAAEDQTALACIVEKIYPLSPQIEYKTMAPACVSHHGRYLALIF